MKDIRLVPKPSSHQIIEVNNTVPIDEGTWYSTYETGIILQHCFDVGTLAPFHWLWADILLDDVDMAIFALELQEGSSGRCFQLGFGLLNQVGARVRLPLGAVDQSRWQIGREGAWLKPMCGGDVVDLSKVDRVTLSVTRKGDHPVRFCVTPFTATENEPPLLLNPVLLSGPVCDAMGQSIQRDWPTKTRSTTEVTERLHGQLAAVGQRTCPESFGRWGGWTNLTFATNGFFRTHHDGSRWWLVDPDGCAFWSMGLDCVRSSIQSYLSGLESGCSELPPEDGLYAPAYAVREGASTVAEGTRFVDFLRVNLIRAFGVDWQTHWAAIAISALKEIGFNTVANWSEWRIASASGVPYVRPLKQDAFRIVPKAFRDFPDVFDPCFMKACSEFATQLSDTRDDPAMIGYFLMNEPNWGFASMTPAEGMLVNTANSCGLKALAGWLETKYGGDIGLSDCWGVSTSLEDISCGEWRERPDSQCFRDDMTTFSSIMVERLFEQLSEACKAVDPNHLNLGARYYTIPPHWALAGMKHFDCFSINCYKDQFPSELISELHAVVDVPVIIGEWHFGALDVGLSGSALRRVRNQEARGTAYRVFAESALAHPACVGAHYFTLYDEAVLGRFDGENWNIGFFDVCHRPYDKLVDAARLTHEQMYQVANRELPAFDKAIEHFPSNVI